MKKKEKKTVSSRYSTDKRYDAVFVYGLDITTILGMKQVYRLLKANNPDLPIVFVGGEKDLLTATYLWRKLALILRAPFSKKARIALKGMRQESGMERMLRVAEETGFSADSLKRLDRYTMLPNIIRDMVLVSCQGRALVAIPERHARILEKEVDGMVKRYPLWGFNHDLLVTEDISEWHNLMQGKLSGWRLYWKLFWNAECVDESEQQAKNRYTFD